mgnify:CR=1 FL=1
MRPYSQHRVEHQYSLLGPAVEVAARGNRRAGVVGYFLEDVLQRGWERHAVRHGETESVGLSFAVIGVLSDDYHFEFVERAFVESPEDVAAARVDAVRGIFLPYELRKGGEIRFLEFGREQLFPVGGDLYIHDANRIKFGKCSKKLQKSRTFVAETKLRP